MCGSVLASLMKRVLLPGDFFFILGAVHLVRTHFFAFFDPLPPSAYVLNGRPRRRVADASHVQVELGNFIKLRGLPCPGSLLSCHAQTLAHQMKVDMIAPRQNSGKTSHFSFFCRFMTLNSLLLLVFHAYFCAAGCPFLVMVVP